MTPWILIPICWVGAGLVMALLWRIQSRSGRSSIVDVAWGLGVAINSAVFAVFADGDPRRRWTVAGLIGIWAVRLTAHVLVRIVRLPEDGRYVSLKQAWGSAAERKMFWFFQVQAFWSVLFALPVLMACRNATSFPNAWDAVGLVIWGIAFIGETVADRQLSRFRENPNNRGAVCREGLWRYSRHPNYFFEWIHWWAYVAFAIGAEHGWLTVFAPVAMLYFLFRVTGIPPTEAQCLISRGDAYRAYQRTTSPFFPWPPKEDMPV